MEKKFRKILLADDDGDDCLFFREALEELPLETSLTIVSDGAELMRLLKNGSELPDVLFLDLNMPRKTGIECLEEIKQIEQLRDVPIIIYTTSLDRSIVQQLYEKGANHYIRKPADFPHLREVIYRAVNLTAQKGKIPTAKESFIIDFQ